jgi:hypothetical protein
MKTLLLIALGTLGLAVLVVWLSFQAVELLRELAPRWLTPDGKLPLPALRPRTTRLVSRSPRDAKKKEPAQSPKNEFSHLPRFAHRAPLKGSAAADRNWIT